MSWFTGLAAAAGVAFLGYGAACLRSPAMVREFARFGIGRFRTLTGTLEIAGGAGLLVGLGVLPLLIAAALGLSALMLVVVVARWRLRDHWSLIGPAFLLFLVNGYLVVEGWRRFHA